MIYRSSLHILGDRHKRHFWTGIMRLIICIKHWWTIHHVSLWMSSVRYDHACSVSSDANVPILVQIFAFLSAIWVIGTQWNTVWDMVIIIGSVHIILELKELYLVNLLNELARAEEEFHLVIAFDLLYISFEQGCTDFFGIHGMRPERVVALSTFRLRSEELWRSIYRLLLACWCEWISHRV